MKNMNSNSSIAIDGWHAFKDEHLNPYSALVTRLLKLGSWRPVHGFWCVLLAALFLSPIVLRADLSSTNYAIAGQFTAGSKDTDSTNYQIDDGSVVVLSQGVLSSTSYEMGSGPEAHAARPIAEINSITPAEFAKFYSDSAAEYAVSASDPDNDSLEYKVYQDSTLKDGPQASSTLNWNLSNTDIGRRAIEIQVIDPDGTVSQTNTAYVFRRPVK